MRSIYFGKVKDTMITKDTKYFSLYIQAFQWYFEIIL